MDNLRENLNRLAIEFWCGVGDPNELSSWADAAVVEPGEFHPLIWDLYPQPSRELTAELLLKMAYEVNCFRPVSLEAEPLAIEALRKALEAFAARAMSVQSLCLVANRLDLAFNIELSDVPRPTSTLASGQWWLGDLWNCCDWCDQSWTHDSSPHLHEEAARVSRMLADNSFKPNPLRGSA